MKSTGNERHFFVDLLRVVLSFGILIWHYQHFYLFFGEKYVIAEQPLNEVLFVFYNHGGAFRVRFFWVMSGFILSFLYLGKVSAGGIDFRTFLFKRLVRLYPLHMVTLLFVAGFVLAHQAFGLGLPSVYEHNDAYHFLLNLFMASNWGFEAGYSFNGPFWAVSVEMPVLASFFLLARLFGARPLPWIALVVILAGVKQHAEVLACASFFYVGCLTTVFLKAGPARLKAYVAVLLALVALHWAVRDVELSFGSLGFIRRAIRMVDDEVTMALVFSLLLVFGHLLLARNPFPRFAVSRLSDLSYSLYMIHFPLQLVAANLLHAAGMAVDFRSLGALLAYMAGSYACAALVNRRIDAPLKALARRWLLGDRVTAT